MILSKIICVANQKGGVGKTTLASNLGASLALEGKSTLLIDLDSLCSLTKAQGYNPDDFDSSIITVFENVKNVPQCIYETGVDNLSIIPSSPMLDVAETSYINKKDKFDRLKKALEIVKPIFEYIVIDTSPTLNLYTINALAASDCIVIPAETKYQSMFSLEVFISSIEAMKEMKNPDLKLLGVVATMYNCQANEDKEVLTELEEQQDILGIIKRTTAASSAVKKGLPCVVANKRTVVAQEYREITKRIMKLLEVK